MSVEKLASEYATFLKFDSSSNIKAIEETIDETLTRLEEFETLLAMVKSDSEMPLAQSVLKNKAELLEMCLRVRCLEQIVATVRSSVDSAEAAVAAAENDLQRQEGLFGFVMPLFSRRSHSSATVQTSSPGAATFSPQFSSSDFFLPDQGVDAQP